MLVSLADLAYFFILFRLLESNPHPQSDIVQSEIPQYFIILYAIPPVNHQTPPINAHNMLSPFARDVIFHNVRLLLFDMSSRVHRIPNLPVLVKLRLLHYS